MFFDVCGDKWARSSSQRRWCTTMANTTKAKTAPLKQAMRHEPVQLVIPAMNTGAAAQPTLPEMPWTENAWPMFWGETRWFKIVKSTG